jgi:hypothetical protein
VRSGSIARRRVLAGVAVALLVGAACGVLLWEPWHGPIILSLSSTHGIDTGDLPALILVALAVAVGRAGIREGRSSKRPRVSWVGPASAILLGLLLLAVVVDTTTMTTLVPAGGGTFGGRTEHTDGDRASPADRWSHLAVTYDGARIRLYVNGEEVSSETASGDIRKTSDPLWIGGNEPYGEYFDGKIDDVRVYDRALDRSELRMEMSTPRDDARITPTAGLVAAYEFDAGSGGRVADASGEGNTGSIIRAAWTLRGHVGHALSFDGAGEAVRVPSSASLDLGDAMTLAAWVRPARAQTGWRTILHRQTDAYFLTASGIGVHDDHATLNGLRVAALIVAAICLCVALIVGPGRWIGGKRRVWWAVPALFVAGCAVDAALAPTPALVAATLIAAWLGLTASDQFEARTMWLLATAFVAVSATSLTGGIDLAGDEGGIARSAALGLLLVAIGLLGLRHVQRRSPRPPRPG